MKIAVISDFEKVPGAALVANQLSNKLAEKKNRGEESNRLFQPSSIMDKKD